MPRRGQRNPATAERGGEGTEFQAFPSSALVERRDNSGSGVREPLHHPQAPIIPLKTPSKCGEAEPEENVRGPPPGTAASHYKGSDFWGSERWNWERVTPSKPREVRSEKGGNLSPRAPSLEVWGLIPEPSGGQGRGKREGGPCVGTAQALLPSSSPTPKGTAPTSAVLSIHSLDTS